MPPATMPAREPGREPNDCTQPCGIASRVIAVQNGPADGPGIDALAAAVEAKAAQDPAFRAVLENLVRDARSDEAGAWVVNQFLGETRINKQVNIGTVKG